MARWFASGDDLAPMRSVQLTADLAMAAAFGSVPTHRIQREPGSRQVGERAGRQCAGELGRRPIGGLGGLTTDVGDSDAAHDPE
jgi:hypothetical protein